MVGNENMIVASVLSLFSGGVGPWEIAIILAALLLLFGGRKLPELARGLGKGLRNFKEELHGTGKEIEEPAKPDDSEDDSDSAKPADTSADNANAKDE